MAKRSRKRYRGSQSATPAAVDMYIRTALWSESDEYGQPLADNYGSNDLGDGEYEKAVNDLSTFIDEAAAENAMFSEVNETQVGMDFWLSRNGHGSGFFDKPEYYPTKTLRDDLMRLAKKFGETNLYVGDDGKLYFSR